MKKRVVWLLLVLAMAAAVYGVLWAADPMRLRSVRGARVLAQQGMAQSRPAPQIVPEPEIVLAPNEHLLEKSGEVTLLFGGDVNLADNWYMMPHYEREGALANCFDDEILQQMQSADILMLNNEFAMSDGGEENTAKQYRFRAKTANAHIWRLLGADIVSVANNHVFDYGEAAFYDTLQTLDEYGIAYVGGGKNLAEAARAQIYITQDGYRIAFVAASRAEKTLLATPPATADTAGILSTYDNAVQDTLDAISAAAQQADYVVVYVHWGTENSTRLEKAQTELASQYQAAGADLIIGGHPHILQGAGWRENTPVLYSLGNYWFNNETVDTALVQVTLRTDGSQTVRLLPCLQTGGKTYLLHPDSGDYARIIAQMNAVSENARFDETGLLLRRDT